MANSLEQGLHTISADSFIRALAGDSITDENGISLNFFNGSHIVVENVKVTENINIDSDIELKYIIEIKSGEFHQFVISGGKFKESFIISGGTFNKAFIILKGEFNSTIEIKGAIFKSEFRISGGTYNQAIRISGGDFEGLFVIETAYLLDLTIWGGEFKDEVWIGNTFANTSIGIFQITNGVFYKKLIINRLINKVTFRIEGGDFRQELCIRSGNYGNEFIIANGNFLSDVIFESGTIRQLVVKEGFLKRIEIKGEVIISTVLLCGIICFEISIVSAEINKIIISCLLKNTGSLYFKKITPHIVTLEDLENEGKIKFVDIKSGLRLTDPNNFCSSGYIINDDINNNNSIFKIQNSDIGNISFFNTDFESFNTVIIKDSRINDIKTINGHIPTSKNKTIYTSDYKTQDCHYLEELYNQLYLAMQKQGNRTQEIAYYSEFLEYHRKNKLDELKEYTFLKRVYNADWYTPCLLWIHKNTSNYGTNWLRSFLLILGCGGIIYTGYTYFLGYKYFDINYLNFHARYFIEFILPIHKIDLIPNSNINGWAATLDILGRIVIGFLVYQTIAGFRRFGKR